MTYRSILLAMTALCLSASAADAFKVKDFVNTYCLECHGGKKTKASVSFATADFAFEKHASVYFWQDTLDVLNSGEMPPEDEKQPSSEELKNAIGTITEKLQAARKRLEATGGVISMRHLNRREYAGSIEDLFGVSVSTDELPPTVATIRALTHRGSLTCSSCSNRPKFAARSSPTLDY